MGRSTTPPYYLQITRFSRPGEGHTIFSRFAWRGRATANRLSQWVKDFEESQAPGEINETQKPITILACRVVHNKGPLTGETKVEWVRPLFVVE